MIRSTWIANEGVVSYVMIFFHCPVDMNRFEESISKHQALQAGTVTPEASPAMG